ncbi:MAG: hypothetical protein OXQ92_15215 [Boseongicola sp.]|nr:hypothetical protein [Boseongicola sp.]
MKKKQISDLSVVRHRFCRFFEINPRMCSLWQISVYASVKVKGKVNANAKVKVRAKAKVRARAKVKAEITQVVQDPGC